MAVAEGVALGVAETGRAAGFERINVDLIYGTPGESLSDWRETLEEVELVMRDGKMMDAQALRTSLGGPCHQRRAQRAGVAFSPPPPIMIGGRGFWIGIGSLYAASTV